MFICTECGKIFSNPARWKEDRGEYFGFPTCEEFVGCPYCHGVHTEAYQCDDCGKWITDTYIRVKHHRYCQDCYQIFELGDEY